MAQPDLAVKPQPDDMYIIFGLLNPAYLRVRREGRACGFMGELVTGRALVDYAVSVLHLSPGATTYEIANKMPPGMTFLMLTNPCAPAGD